MQADKAHAIFPQTAVFVGIFSDDNKCMGDDDKLVMMIVKLRYMLQYKALHLTHYSVLCSS